MTFLKFSLLHLIGGTSSTLITGSLALCLTTILLGGPQVPSTSRPTSQLTKKKKSPLVADSLRSCSSHVQSGLSFFLSCLPSGYVLQVEIHRLIKISFLHRTLALNLESLSSVLVCKFHIFLPKVSAPSSHSSACSLRLGRGKLTSG